MKLDSGFRKEYNDATSQNQSDGSRKINPYAHSLKIYNFNKIIYLNRTNSTELFLLRIMIDFHLKIRFIRTDKKMPFAYNHGTLKWTKLKR